MGWEKLLRKSQPLDHDAVIQGVGMMSFMLTNVTYSTLMHIGISDIVVANSRVNITKKQVSKRSPSKCTWSLVSLSLFGNKA